MAKKTTKTKKDEPKDYVFYKHKNHGFLFVSDKFIYEMFVYELNSNYIGLFDSKQTEVNEFKGFITCSIVEKNKKRFQQIIELVGAPIDFLESHHFNLI